jgi:hypothetical protein
MIRNDKVKKFKDMPETQRAMAALGVPLHQQDVFCAGYWDAWKSSWCRAIHTMHALIVEHGLDPDEALEVCHHIAEKGEVELSGVFSPVKVH